MPARSRAQQRAAGMALAARRGELDPRKLKGAALQMYESMTERQLEDFAATQSRDLPEHRSQKS